MPEDRALEQTRKLIALAVNNPAQEEARSAAQKACTLILAHGFVVQRPGQAFPEPPPIEFEDDVPPAWGDALRVIRQLDADPAFQWAHTTIRGIRTWVETHGRITPKQWRAISNIRRCR